MVVVVDVVDVVVVELGDDCMSAGPDADGSAQPGVAGVADHPASNDPLSPPSEANVPITQPCPLSGWAAKVRRMPCELVLTVCIQPRREAIGVAFGAAPGHVNWAQTGTPQAPDEV